jgi:hypothetical protein
MPVSLPDVEAHLVSMGYEPKVAGPGHFVIGGRTNVYCDQDGDPHAYFQVRVDEDGEYVRVFASCVYDLTDCKHKCATLAALAGISYRQRSVQCGYDSEDGEVCYSLDTWVLDGTLTQIQLARMISLLAATLDGYDPVVRHAMQTGEVDFSREAESRSARSSTGDEAKSEELAELLERIGGMEGLRTIVEGRAQQSDRPAP